MKASEQIKAAEKWMSDNFLTFSRMLAMLLEVHPELPKNQQQLLQRLGNYNVRYGGSPLNRAMLQAATCVHQTIDDAAAAALLAIEREYGRDIFSSSYNKIARLCQLAQSFTKNQSRGSGTDATKDAVTFLLENCLCYLRRKIAQPCEFTLNNIDSRDGRPGWVAMTLTKQLALQQLFSIAPALETPDASKIRAAVQKVSTPTLFHASVPQEVQPQEAAEAEQTDAQPLSPAANPEGSSIAHLTEGMSKGGVALVECIVDLWEGSFDSDLYKAAGSSQ